MPLFVVAAACMQEEEEEADPNGAITWPSLSLLPDWRAAPHPSPAHWFCCTIFTENDTAMSWNRSVVFNSAFRIVTTLSMCPTLSDVLRDTDDYYTASFLESLISAASL